MLIIHFAVPHVLFGLGINQALHFHPCTAIFLDYLLRFLEIPGYQECYTFFKLIEYVFLSTTTFNQ